MWQSLAKILLSKSSLDSLSNMGQFINLLIILGSLGGIAFILYRKIPLLLNLPADPPAGGEEQKQSVVSRLAGQVQEKILDTTLSKARALASKTETQTSEWLDRLRKKSEQKKEEFRESYWEQLRKKSQDKNNQPG